MIRGMEIPSLARRFDALATLVRSTAPLWRPAPFYHTHLPWAADLPALAHALHALGPAEIEAFEDDDATLRGWLANHLPVFSGVEPFLNFRLNREILPIPVGWHAPAAHIPGRKWAQIERFAAAVIPATARSRGVIDWCGGKSHLGRLLGRHAGLPVQLFERDATLCQSASHLALRDGVTLAVAEGDVLEYQATLPADHQVVALHACGELHRHLLDRVADSDVAAVALSPCCYHRTRDALHVWRSPGGRASGLRLSREELRLAVLETMTAAPRERIRARTRRQGLLALMLWAERSGRPLSSVAGLPWAWGQTPEENVGHLVRAAGLRPPDAAEFAALWQEASSRERTVRAFELLRQAIRRPLEVLLVVDMALGLEAAGYTVEVQQFCERTLTPRNLLLTAERPRNNPHAG